MAAFVPLAPLLTQDQLDQLTPQQLATLREEIQKEIRTHGAIQTRLKERAREVYTQLTGGPPKP